MAKYIGEEADQKAIAKRKEITLLALEKSKGIVKIACDKANISRATFYNYTSNDPDFKAKVEEIKESQIDLVEASLIQGAVKGNVTAQIFYLKTQARSRGYVEHQQLDVTTKGESIKTDAYDGLSEETKKRIASELYGIDPDLYNEGGLPESVVNTLAEPYK